MIYREHCPLHFGECLGGVLIRESIFCFKQEKPLLPYLVKYIIEI